jgi:hypothetical protein
MGETFMTFNGSLLARVLVLACGAGSLSACATVTRGANDAWVVNTEPAGARVETSNGRHCASTPCAIKMSRKAEFTATITKPGYKTANVSVSHKTANAGAAGVAGNVLLGGVIGLGVDMVSGASQDLVPNPVYVNLERLDADEGKPQKTKAEVAAVDQPPAPAPKKVCAIRSPTNPDAVKC